MPKRDVVLVMNLALRPSRGGVARAQTVAPAAGGNGVADAWFYLVRGRSGGAITVDPSTEVGLLEYVLTPGR